MQVKTPLRHDYLKMYPTIYQLLSSAEVTAAQDRLIKIESCCIGESIICQLENYLSQRSLCHFGSEYLTSADAKSTVFL